MSSSGSQKDKSSSKSLMGKFDKVVGNTFGKKEKHKRPPLPEMLNNNPWPSSPSDGDASSFPSPSTPNMDASLFSDKELEAFFEKMLVDRNIPPDAQKTMRSLPREKKIVMVNQSLTLQNETATGKNPANYVQKLDAAKNLPIKDLREILESVRVALTNNPVSWIIQFGARGLNLLLNHLHTLNRAINEKKQTDHQWFTAQHDCIKCLKAYTNNKKGAFSVLSNPNFFQILVESVNIAHPQCMADALMILSAFILLRVPDESDNEASGFDAVLEALTVVGEVEGRDRFLQIVLGLYDENSPSLQVASMILINTLITLSDDLDFRIHLRNEFMRAGLIDIIDSLELTENPVLNSQVDTFCNNRDADSEEFFLRFDVVRAELDSPQEVFDLIMSKVEDTPSEPYFLSILQHMLFVRDDVLIRPAYYKLAEECIAQIVLHRSGCDPDFRTHRRFQLDVDYLTEKIVDASAEEGGGPILRELNKKLDVTTTAKQELEARMSQYTEKVKEYQEEVKQLRDHISDGGKTPLPKPTSDSLPPPSIPSAPAGPPCAPPPPAPPLPGGTMPPPPPPPLPPGAIGGGGIPPPPPLPPGGPPGAPPPPPPFGGMPGAPFNMAAKALPDFLTPKSELMPKTDVKLRKFMWTAISPSNLQREGFWAGVKGGKIVKDRSLFEDLNVQFSTKPVGKITGGVNAADGAVSKSRKAKKPVVIHDDKILQALAILQGSAKLSFEEWRKGILEIDEKIISESLLEQLRSALPPPDIMEQLNAHEKEYDNMPEGEQFVFQLAKIKKLPSRLKFICFKLRFEEYVADIKPSIVAVTEACDDIRQSRGFAYFLELVLIVGNYMGSNVTSFKETFAFEMNTLTKLSGTKAVDNTTTLLHFVVEKMDEECQKSGEDLQNFTIADFVNAVKATKVSLKDLQINVDQMKNSIKQLETLLETFEPQGGTDRFSEVMRPFLVEAKHTSELLMEMHKNMLRKFAELAKYYSFDAKKYTMEEFFGDLKIFKGQYEEAQKDNAKKKELMKPKPTRKPAKVASKKVSRQEILDLTRDGDCEGLMDNLMDALKDGRAFPQRGTPQKRTPRSGNTRQLGISRQRSRHIHPMPMVATEFSADSPSSSQNNSFGLSKTPNHARNGEQNNVRNNNQDATATFTDGPQPGLKVRRKGKAAVAISAEQLGGRQIAEMLAPSSKYGGNSESAGSKSDSNGNLRGKGSSTEDLLERLKNL